MHSGPAPPTWTRVSEIPSCVRHRANLQRTVATALAVGTVLFLINHLDPVLRGRVGAGVWVATGISFVVPFLVANTGLLVALRRPGAGGKAAGPRPPSAATPTWARVAEMPRCILHRRHLVRTVGIALVVGTVYFVVNQLGTVSSGGATISTWVASGATYLVPFSVSNLGVLVGTRRGAGGSAPGTGTRERPVAG